jgi:hypothetical protein
MALPGSGVLSLKDIATEQGIAVSDVSLRSMSAAAGFSTPDSVSEFYGYDAYTYLGNWAAGDPCNYDYWNIYQRVNGVYYRFDGTYYDPMYNYTNYWYEYLYYDSGLGVNIYRQWEINSLSTVLTDTGNYFSYC